MEDCESFITRLLLLPPSLEMENASSSPTTRLCNTFAARHFEYPPPEVRSPSTTAAMHSAKAKALGTASTIYIPKLGASAPLIQRLSPCFPCSRKPFPPLYAYFLHLSLSNRGESTTFANHF